MDDKPAAVYVWSDSLNRTDGKTLVGWLGDHSFERMILSIDRRADREKVIDLREQVGRAGSLTMDPMLSTNVWIYPRNHDSALQELRNPPFPLRRLHLDIEPQALPEYEETPDEMVEHYVTLIEKIAVQFPQLQPFSLSVPHYWSRSTYRRLSDHADEFFFMVYGQMTSYKRYERVRRTLADLDGLEVEVWIALHVDDFRSQREFRRSAQRIVCLDRVTGIAIHDHEGYEDLLRRPTWLFF